MYRQKSILLWNAVTPAAEGGKGGGGNSGKARCDDHSSGNGHGSGGGSGDDVITAVGSHLTLSGKGGNDSLTASGSHNDLDGGSGNDALTSRGDHNKLDGGDGNDTLTATGDHNQLRGGSGNDALSAIGDGNNLRGGDGNDTLTATGSHNQLRGGGGNDTLAALGGSHNQLFGGDGNDTLISTGTRAEMEGGRGNDAFVVSGPSGNVINGGDGIDTVTYTGPQAVSVDLREHGATLVGSKHNKDVLIKIENVTGGSGNDIVTGDDGANVLSGGAGNDTLNGGRGNDTLIGGTGNDVLSGGAGDDLYVGLDGTDRIDGGSGNDSLVLTGNVADYQFSHSGSSWTVSDGAGNIATLSGVESIQLGDRTLWLNGRNNTPILAGPLSVASNEDAAPTSINLLAGARDVDGNPLSAVQLTQTGGRNLVYSLGTDGHLILDPAQFNDLAAGMAEILTFTYQVSDGVASVPQTLTLTIEGRNDAPVITSVNGVLASDHTGGTGSMAASDSDQGVTLTYHLWDGTQAVDSLTTAHGSVSIDPATGIYTFTPNAEAVSLGLGQSAADGFQVVTVDEHGAFSRPAAVAVTVTGSNDAPVISGALSGGVGQDGGVYTTDLLAGASDVDNGATLSVVGLTQTGGPGAVFGLDGSGFSLDPGQFAGLAEGETATLVFEYQVSDGQGGSVPQSLTVTVTGSNDAPVISGALSGGVGQDGGVYTADLLAGASDVDHGATLSVVGLTQTGGPGAVFGLDGSGFSLDPGQFAGLAEGETATLVFEYQVSDGQGGSVPQSLTVTVTGSNDAPVISGALSGGVGQDGGVHTTDLLAGASDVDNGATLSVVGLTQTGGPGAVFGLDGSGFSLDPAQFAGLAEGETATLVFEYQVSDGQGGSVPQSLTVTVTGSNDAPVISGMTGGAGDEDSVISGRILAYDPDHGDSLSYALAADGAPAHGSVVINADGTYAYTPVADYNGADSFTVRVFDPHGAGAGQFVNIMVSPVNDAPSLAVPGPVTTIGGSSTPLAGIVVADADGGMEQLTLSVGYGTLTLGSMQGLTLVGGALGSASIVVQGSLASLNASLATLIYVPSSTYSGSDTVSVSVNDMGNGGGSALTAGAGISITVQPNNRAPVAVGDVLSGWLNSARTYTAAQLLANDSDPDGDPLSITWVGNAVHGTVALDQSGNVVFTPQAGYIGPASFEYTVSDGNGHTSTVSDAVMVQSISANDGTLSTVLETAANGTLSGINPTGTGLTYSVSTAAEHGTLSVNANGSYTYTPEAGFTGADHFTYRITSSLGEVDEGEVAISVGARWQSGALNEFMPHASTLGGQTAYGLYALPDGGFCVVWTDYRDLSPKDSYGIWARKYTSSGVPVGNEFAISPSSTSNRASGAVITRLANGNIIFSWSQGNDVDWDPYARICDANMNPLGASFRINTYSTGPQGVNEIIPLNNGGFIAAWTSTGQDGDREGAYARVFSATGQPLTGEIRYANNTTGRQFSLGGEVLANGNVMLIWSEEVIGGTYNNPAYAKFFTPSGNPVGSTVPIAGRVVPLSDGGYAVLYDRTINSQKSLYGRLFTSTGATNGAEFKISDRPVGSRIAKLSDGRFILVGAELSAVDNRFHPIIAQFLDQTCHPVGGVFEIVAHDSPGEYPWVVTATPDGGFIVGWSDGNPDAYMRRFDSTGQPLQDDVMINQQSTYIATPLDQSKQAPSDIIVLADGSVVAQFQSNASNAESYDVYARVFTNDTWQGGIGNDTITGTAANEVLKGAGGNDTLSGGAGLDTLVGGSGADTYQLGRGFGADRIDNTGQAADGDKILFGSGIATDQLWFQQSANDLKVSVIGTADSVTIQGWFSGGTNHVATLQTSDGQVLTDAAVQNLVNAMASLTPPPIGQTTLTTQQHQQLDPVIAANWH